ncbi:phosphatase PAP2 family protein [Gemmobacter lutimaris]|uniref:Phosphatase PAP2 family protein n=1 Tax=Gemmobacter lutimaris TaxID=2306023 RepID=A0A398BJ39_9RHOB|nr:vanadium-dependent haloperoxidase [Gemmobacter lutimaris]RID90659.1 phosphatase PAP2 family protein [Gemmobacter lutimaris]
MFQRFVAILLLCAGLALPGSARAAEVSAAEVMTGWYRLILELVRHTPTYSPPVAARAFGYLGVTVWEVEAATSGRGDTLAGQLNGLSPRPELSAGLDPAIAMQGAMARAVPYFFGNTGPTGQRAMAAMDKRLTERLGAGSDATLVAESLAAGQRIADHIIAWSESDGGAKVENMGFPETYVLTAGPAHWVPTSAIVQQQKPLLPDWGRNRPFAMPEGNACPLPAPPAYSEAPGSAFHAEAQEVYDTSRSLTPEQLAIARFWSDDPMLSPTPPGHWLTILLDQAEAANLSDDRLAEALARLGIGMGDAFIGCWHSKFEFDLVRPVTYIRRVIDPTWEPQLITPPFPEYPSGHSTLSGAAAEVMTAIFGEDHAFDDSTHEDDGLPARHFADFRAAAQEAAVSRLYGGIHFRAAIERGLAQGACIAGHANALRMRQ